MFTHLQGKLRQRIRALNETAEAGFTLIELLVVIVILGILAAVVVFSVRGINDKGQGSACKTDKSTIQTAEEAFFANGNNEYGSMDDLEKGGFLSSASTLYDVTLNADHSQFDVTPKSGAACANYK
ncbi:prepilin-type N-terminal cleavage/methylation domain-containing protein [Streptomyces sp. SID10853]|uniref:type IV pilin protein n=1 Tax=Streptomyces sp. SID10853 TaxID=2706028 RepID=UPI0013C19034|nr:prepilin-type N-terminal cleavage/methylation domain-containing protein [Streptomyces sp. SID10853]NDZ78870.1 prepilin-type N-terminal cleavage/methylation domain-containing protein [Streptomyces sp. SID10853]